MRKQCFLPEKGTQRRLCLTVVAFAAAVLVTLQVWAPASIGTSRAADAGYPSNSPAIVELGAAGSYSALASAALTAPGGSAAGATSSSNGDSASQAQEDLATAYNAISKLTPTATVSGDLGGLTIRPGIYFSDAALAVTKDVTFDALGDPNAVFIFQVGAAVNTTAGIKMILVNRAQASRVYWQTAAAVTTGASSSFTGTILGNAAITAGAGTVLQGRALTMNGAVTLDSTELLPVPDISITSSVAPTIDVEAGDPVVFTNVIRNRGNVSLALSLDTGLPPSAMTTIAWPDDARELPAGQSIVATTTYAPTLADAAQRQITSAATVVGTPAGFGAVSASSSVTLIVHPTPVVDRITTAEGTAVSVNVLTNDAGAEVGGVFSRATLGTKRRLVSGATGPVPTSAVNGSVACVDSGPDRGLCTYQPAGLFFGTDYFDYTLSQDTRSWNVRVTVTVTPVAAAPVARDDRVVATTGGEAVAFDPTANDTNLSSGTLAITASSALPAGEGDLACSRASCVYTPPTTGFTGSVSASYTVADSSGSTSTANITIFVDAPALTSSGYVASSSTGTTISVGSWQGSTAVTAAAGICTAGRVSTTLSWQPLAGTTSWALSRRLAGNTPGPWIALSSLPASATTYVDGQLGEGNAYQWQVRPDNNRWSGVFSPPSPISEQPAAVNAAGC